MKTLTQKSTMAVAVSLILGSSAAFAVGPIPTSTVTTNNNTSVSLTKDVNVSKALRLDGDVSIEGTIKVQANSMATVDDKQINYENSLDTGSVGDPNFMATINSVDGNSGNTGVNVTSGVYNQQDNAAAIAAIDAAFIHGSTDAESFAHQAIFDSDNLTLNGPQFTADLASVQDNTGNVGVNLSSGVSNQQKNNLAISTGHSKLAEASSAALQEVNSLSVTLNAISPDDLGMGGVGINFTSTLGDVAGNAGNVGVNVASGVYNQQANSLSIAATAN